MKDITKKQFIMLMNAIEEEDNKLRDIGKYIETYSSSYVILYSKISESLVKFLEDYYQTDLISWWLYEDVEKVIYENNQEISLKNIEELYTYINKEI